MAVRRMIMFLSIFKDDGPAVFRNGPQWHGGPDLVGLPEPPTDAVPYRVRQVVTATGAYRTQIASCELFDLSEADRQALVRFFGEVNEVTEEPADSFRKVTQEDLEEEAGGGFRLAAPPESRADELARLREEVKQLREENRKLWKRVRMEP